MTSRPEFQLGLIRIQILHIFAQVKLRAKGNDSTDPNGQEDGDASVAQPWPDQLYFAVMHTLKFVAFRLFLLR